MVNMKKIYLRILHLTFLLSMGVISHLSSANQASSEALANKTKAHEKLTSLQKTITQQKLNIKSVNLKRSQLEESIKNDDLAIANIINKLQQTTLEKQKTLQKLNDLTQEKYRLNLEKKTQENSLGQQLRAAYSTGHHDYLKLLLNQEDPSSIQRTITYYQYLNKARMQEIDAFESTLLALEKVEASYIAEQQKLAQLEQTQTQQKTSLQTNKVQRENNLRLLAKDLLTQQQKLEQLIAEESNLVSALKQLAQAAQTEINLNGLSHLKHKLSWPVKGKLVHRFGTRKQGYLKWKGVLINTPDGKQVKTIHNGTVLFSDWLKGYGLVTVIDHGKGYMSLYGHNQALLKSVGDRVETGEPIALAGQSGGQNQTGLYFEIRYRGKAMNPKTWCK